MSRVNSLSVLICTYNRSALLEQTLEALQRACPPDRCAVEVDRRRQQFERRHSGSRSPRRSPGPYPVHYLAERQQGKSFALNSGLAIAHGDVIALTDDDVLAGQGLAVSASVANFRARTWCSCSESAASMGSTAAARNGDAPCPRHLGAAGAHRLRRCARSATTRASFGKKRLPVGANLAVRRQAIEHVGGWRTDLGRVDNTTDRRRRPRTLRPPLPVPDSIPESTIRLYVVKHLVPATRV